jgi:hypothetical protein
VSSKDDDWDRKLIRNYSKRCRLFKVEYLWVGRALIGFSLNESLIFPYEKHFPNELCYVWHYRWILSYDIIFCFSSFSSSLHNSSHDSLLFIEEKTKWSSSYSFQVLCSLYSGVRARLLIIKWKYVFTAANNSWINNFFVCTRCSHKALRLHKNGICSLYYYFFFGKKSSTFYVQPAPRTKAEILVCSLVHLPKMDYCSSWQQKWLLASLSSVGTFYFDENFMPWSSASLIK